ncbi:putative HTH-type transcriptional regulator YdeP [Agaricicola taiwanensis]|uniref:Putative HTH-type transcriptional regulator YdeP n=1 Tax=Agaricicola taiwanensis TaxID=591372 RepID=A0A8J2YG91_9RHOB|nr:helix-turn-helix domain-containing protein [Agaricicola taiwanensis]GGE37543.1 putative HTH-type transcriptional regulator YdeP [Agaricicola taiwanensis]
MKNVPYGCAPGCPVEQTLAVMGGKWKGVILYHLLDGTMRFNELMRQIPSVTQRMLTRQLRELESAGLVRRTVYPVVPPRVEYDLTDLGRSLEAIVRAMRDWGELYRRRLEEVPAGIAAE